MKNVRAYGMPSDHRVRRARYGRREDMNKVLIVGRLVDDPDFRRTPSGVLMTRFRVSTTVGGSTESYSVVAWARLGQLVARQFTKGQMIRVDGSLRKPTREVIADWCYSVPRDYIV
jgi:hypothetical protein